MEGILEVGSSGHLWTTLQSGNLHGFTLPRQQWSLLNRFHIPVKGTVGPVETWHLTETKNLFLCGETQTMSHIVESCPLTKLNGGLSQLHSAEDDAIA